MSASDHEQHLFDTLNGVNGKSASAAAIAAAGDVHVETTDTEPPPPATVTEPAVPLHVTSSNFWRHPDAHPLALDLFMLRKYGPDWLGWEAETMRVLIPEDFHTPSVSELNIAKLQACKTLHLVDTFWKQWEVFVACLGPLNSEFPDFTTMPAPSVGQVLVACDVAERIRADVEWSEEMKAYIATVYRYDGIFLPLPPADFIHLEVPEEIDTAELARRWPEVRAKEEAPTAATPLDEQLRRLLHAYEYLEDSRTRLRLQLQLHV